LKTKPFFLLADTFGIAITINLISNHAIISYPSSIKQQFSYWFAAPMQPNTKPSLVRICGCHHLNTVLLFSKLAKSQNCYNRSCKQKETDTNAEHLTETFLELSESERNILD